MAEIKSIIEKLFSVRWSWSRAAIDQNLAQLGAHPIDPTATSSNPEDQTFVDAEGVKIQAIYCCEFRGHLVSYLIASAEVDDLEEEEFDAIASEFDQKFEAAIAEAKIILGEPNYWGATGGSDLTKGQFADLVACWLTDSGRLMIQEGQADTELPIELKVVMAAPIKI
jgi:hypothetical protein